jgi:Bacterial Ig domain
VKEIMNRLGFVLLVLALAIVNTGCVGLTSATNKSATAAPSITSQPISQTVTAGQTATFTVAVTGNVPLTYQWWKKTVPISGATSSTYTTPVTTASDNGAQFTVVVSNSSGNITSNVATLTVNPASAAPLITTEPASQTVNAGQTATFSVVATGMAPLTYLWHKDGMPISGATSSSYTTQATMTSDSGAQFTAVVSNSTGSTTSSPARLTVNPAMTAPSIIAQPASQIVMPGQAATFNVAATGTAPLRYQWKKNAVAITGAISSSYTTLATTISDNGAQFVVVVNNSAGSATSNVAGLTVNPAPVAPSIATQPSSQTVTAGQTAIFFVAATGTAPLNYQWQKNGSAISGATSSNYTTPPTTSSDNGEQFSVVVTNAAGRVTSNLAALNVATPLPTVAITAPVNGATVSATINISGTASDTVSLSSVQISVDGGTFVNASGTNNWTSTLNTGSLSNGPHTLTAKVTDAASISASSSPISITVNNGSLATDCTLFASPSGNNANSGTAPSSPKTFSGAAAATQPGSVVCLLGGTYNLSSTFYPPSSGTPSSWIVYKNYGDAPVNFLWTAGPITQPMFKFGAGSFPSNPAYLEFRGLNLDGQNNALDGFFCYGSHHLRFIANSISNTGGSGVGAVSCDYLTSDHNLINHNGYLYGWTSGISYNNIPWFDSYPGFHNIISNNIIAGEYDGSTNHTDGNGIILDLGSNTPSSLIINNVVYGNGGRCIQANVVTNFWFVNNTCYKNNLDTSLGNAGSLTTQGSSNGYFINNITLAWQPNNPSYDQEGTNSNIHYYADLYFGSSLNFSYSDPSQFIQADPLFLTPPLFLPAILGQYATALAPSLLGNGLTLLPLSPAYNRGIDPSTLSGIPSAIVTDLKTYIYTDINGKPRPQGGGSDLGAYQH